ncbi:MAG: hypothetical protein RL113_1477, partial [Pseudomonadota bacterium]
MKIQFSATVVLCLMATAGYAGVALGTLPVADVKAPKYAIKSNYEIMYNDSPKKVESFMEMFQQGTFYGRLRSNTFMYNWEKENSTQQDHITSGLGGSLVYKSASLDAFDFTAAFYYTHGFTDISPEDVTYMKGGAEVLNRFDYSNTGSQDLGVLGQAYLRYTGITQSEVSVGRQLVETFYTKSNDTKMIPNTFDAVVFDTNIIRNTQVKVGYLAKEKLRGHSDAHSVLVYGDANSSSSLNPSWDENDDSAMHKGLTYTKLEAAGKADQPL